MKITYITPEHIERARQQINIPWGPMGQDTFLSRYSRTKGDGTQEDWYETCARVVNGNFNLITQHLGERAIREMYRTLQEEALQLYELMVRMVVLPGGRHLWATGIADNRQFLNNCHCADFTSSFSEHFTYTFMRLMEGGGVGANYSNLFIHSNPHHPKGHWVPEQTVRLHLLCRPDHPDIDKPMLIESVADIPPDRADEYTPERMVDHVDPRMVQVVDREQPNGNLVRSYMTTMRQLLSSEYVWNYDAANGNYIRVEDSREGWCRALQAVLEAPFQGLHELIVDLSNIRPFGAEIRAFGGRASGPTALALMLYRINLLLNESAQARRPLGSLQQMTIDHYIAQAVISGGTRRSARMAMKYWKDEDIFEFINCKTHPTRHWSTNISVVVDNKFFRALKRGDDWAERVYDAVVEGMLRNGEPGFINASRALDGEAVGTTFYSTNPCVARGTRISCERGLIPIEELYTAPEGLLIARDRRAPAPEEEVNSEHGVVGEPLVDFYSVGERPVLRLRLESGLELVATPDHEILTPTGYVPLSKLSPGDLVTVQSGEGLFPNTVQLPEETYAVLEQLMKEQQRVVGTVPRNTADRYPRQWYEGLGRLIGVMLSAGYYHGGYCGLLVDPAVYKKIRPWTNQWMRWFGLRIRRPNPQVRQIQWRRGVGQYLSTLGMRSFRRNEPFVPESMFRAPRHVTIGFLQGLFAIRGKVLSSESGVKLVLESESKGFLRDVQLLLTQFGVLSYQVQDEGSLRLEIRDAYCRLFADRIGLGQIESERQLQHALTRHKHTWSDPDYTDRVESVEPAGHAYVYDLKAVPTFSMITNGIPVKDCGEIAFVRYHDLPAFDVCCLGHVNLGMVRDDQEAERAFRLMTRFLIRATFAPSPDPKQKANIERNRRIGVGFLGYHTWLVRRGIRYSEAADREDVRWFFRQMKAAVDEEARRFASALRIPEPIKKTTIAPTGTVSRLPGVSYGLEPVFSKYYIRRVRYANNEPRLEEIRRQGGRKIEPDIYVSDTSVVEYLTIDPIVSQCPPGEDPEQLIEGHHQLSLEDFLRTQAMFQQVWSDNAISITINVDPNRYCKQELKDQLLQYLPLLKGVTVFPTGSRPQSPLEPIDWATLQSLQEQGYQVDVSQSEEECQIGCPVQ